MCALFAFRLHLTGHAVDEIARRRNVLNFNTSQLHAPSFRGVIDDVQQLGVDLVAVGQELIEIHRTHDSTDVRHRQVDDRMLELIDFVRRFCGIQDLIKGYAIDADHGVIAGDDILARDIHHLLFHVDLVADVFNHWNENMHARIERLGVAAEILNRVVVALRDDLDRRPQRPNN